jgi:hypothetical protein
MNSFSRMLNTEMKYMGNMELILSFRKSGWETVVCHEYSNL